MRLRRISNLLLLLVCSSISATLANSNNALKSSTGRKSPDLDAHPVLLSTQTSPPQIRGVNDAPIDGKDGKPHAGPFVETNAERQRKKDKALADQQRSNPSNPEGSPEGHIGPDGKVIPHSNDGVMDDKNRPGPKEGTRGTEGGVSSKNKDKHLGIEKVPDPPKEAPPLPHSEQQKIPNLHGDRGKKGKEEQKDKLLEKPGDLPESPHSLPPTRFDRENEKNLIKEPIASSPGAKPKVPSDGDHVNEIIQPLHSFVLSFTMILFSEIGDKTFLVAALMAMRHPRMLVFSAAFGALIAMTVLSAMLGHAVPTILPKSYTNVLAAFLFLVFGLKMLHEAKNMRPDENVSNEMKEVEMELEEKEHQQRRMNRRRSSIDPYALESGRAGMPHKTRSSNHRLPTPESISPASSRSNSPPRGFAISSVLIGINNLFSLLLSPAWVQTFVMTFLGEWGDRSQIATIAMAAGQDYWWVTLGAIIGHGMCTAAAVIGGRAIAGKVSIRTVTFGGAIAFLVFGFLYVLEVIY
ncbi:GCR1-dependent translation factor 1 [Ophidiomyces ophidiicola]|nr:GCR1-dependent translation factor 1 [Ophidiomyces ophidiicola]KAI1990506.1 GCR1-dependent translation factor 1 [Ophidiomyces ophidiicola]KAI1994322.1 GCR1-dependent translation factor 1 [Ophidiomyces ophidiicola]KAI1995015.1 GCR1-dependent translation factor 1 [Ophidiomyces ophidiicola]